MRVKLFLYCAAAALGVRLGSVSMPCPAGRYQALVLVTHGLEDLAAESLGASGFDSIRVLPSPAVAIGEAAVGKLRVRLDGSDVASRTR